MNTLQINKHLIYGGLFESGSNENGSWKKYNDGTMIQYGRYTGSSIPVNVAIGNAFRSNDIFIPLPLEFESVDTVTISNGSNNYVWYGKSVLSRDSITYNMFSFASNNGLTSYCYWYAVGTWK